MANKDENNSLEYHLGKVFEIAETFGVDDPLDKCKYRELISAQKLGHNLFKGASGGKYTDATYGADATDENGVKVEYKSAKVTETQYNKFLNGELKKKYKMVYNGAYDQNSIDRYRNIRHVLNLFHKEKLIMSVEVPTDYVIETLTRNLEYDNNRRANGEIVTTNCNSVGVQIEANLPIMGSVL
jgi:hypothetical protein